LLLARVILLLARLILLSGKASLDHLRAVPAGLLSLVLFPGLQGFSLGAAVPRSRKCLLLGPVGLLLLRPVDLLLPGRLILQRIGALLLSTGHLRRLLLCIRIRLKHLRITLVPQCT
jgi:hypothetical protein